MTDAEPGSPPPQLVVGADLTLQSDRADVSITTADGTLVVAVDSIGGLFALYDLQRNVSATAGDWLPDSDALPGERPLVFNSPAILRLRDRVVARYLPGESGGLFGRLSSLPIRLSPRGLTEAVAAESAATLRGWLGE